MKKRPMVSVDLIVVRNDKILLGKLSGRWSDKGKYEWGLPGREIRFGDSFEEAVNRNLREETGMKLKRFRIVCVNNNFAFNNHYVSIGIKAEAAGEPKLTNKDWKEWKWFDKRSIPRKLFPSAEITIRCYLENKVTA